MVWMHQEFSPDTPGILSGVTVVDMSRLVAGNMATLQMADFGADVIKVEPIPSGDPLRAWKHGGVSTFWKVYGRSKRSLGVDFRKPGATELLRSLILKADVLVEGFRPGTLEKMGLDPADLCRQNPRLSVLRISGFGQTGPYSPRPGFGTLAEGMSGFAARNGEKDGPPLLPPLALADMIAGLYGANAVSMALLNRTRTGKGQVIDLALLEAISSILGPEALDFQVTGKIKPRVGNGSNTSCPRNVYRTQDGHDIAISASIQKVAERLFQVIGREDMVTDRRYATNGERVKRRAEVDAIVGAWIGARERDTVLEIFAAEGITAAPIYDVRDIAEDAHFRDRGIIVSVPDGELGRAAMHAPLPRFSEQPGMFRHPAPTVGEHNEAVLAEIELDEGQIANLISAGVIGAEAPQKQEH